MSSQIVFEKEKFLDEPKSEALIERTQSSIHQPQIPLFQFDVAEIDSPEVCFPNPKYNEFERSYTYCTNEIRCNAKFKLAKSIKNDIGRVATIGFVQNVLSCEFIYQYDQMSKPRRFKFTQKVRDAMQGVPVPWAGQPPYYQTFTHRPSEEVQLIKFYDRPAFCLNHYFNNDYNNGQLVTFGSTDSFALWLLGRWNDAKADEFRSYVVLKSWHYKVTTKLVVVSPHNKIITGFGSYQENFPEATFQTNIDLVDEDIDIQPVLTGTTANIEISKVLPKEVFTTLLTRSIPSCFDIRENEDKRRGGRYAN